MTPEHCHQTPARWARSVLLAAVIAALAVALCGAAAAHAESPPVNTVLPVITPNEPEERVVEHATTGTWKNKPTSYKEQWERCKGGSCEVVENPLGGLGESFEYEPLSAEVGYTLRVKVTAKNAGGEASAFSEQTHKTEAALQVTTFKPEGSPKAIATDHESNAWFTENGASQRSVAKITPAGTITKAASWETLYEPLERIATGAAKENALWFTGLFENTLDRLTTEGSFTDYAVGFPHAFTGAAGTEGEWVVVKEGEVERVKSSGTITHYKLTGELLPSGLAYTNGALVMTEHSAEITLFFPTAKETQQYKLPEGSEAGPITAGANGEAWFVNRPTGSTKAKIGRITTGGKITEYELPEGVMPSQIVYGADSRIWFNDEGFSYVGSVTSQGKVTVTYVEGVHDPLSLAAAPDGPVWFVNAEGKVGKLTI